MKHQYIKNIDFNTQKKSSILLNSPD